MKSNKKGKKIRLKSVNTALFGYFCLLSVVLVVLVDLAFYIVMSTTLADQARDRVNAVGAEVRQHIAVSTDEMLEKEFLRYGEEGIDLYLFSADGELMLSARTDISQGRIDELFSKTEGLQKGSQTGYRSSGSVNFAVRTERRGEEVILLASCRLGMIANAVGRAQIFILPISVFVILLALLISYLVSQKMTRGFKNMSAQAIELAKGNYSVSFANADYREMAQMSDTLNYVRDEVKKSRDFQRDILANVTHDLKTPLTMIKAYASMIQEISGDNPEKRNKHLQVIIDESDRLAGLVNDVLSISKVNSGLDEINPKVFNLTEYLYGIINKFGYLQESGYNLMVDIDANLYTRADEEKIGQVFYNLLGNAVSYTGEDKTVYISLKKNPDGARIRFSVRDTGKGISEEELPNIWDRYFRGSENHNRPVKGTGLGLNIVKVILVNHAFDFGAESKEGEGSTFWVDFPYISPDPEDDG